MSRRVDPRVIEQIVGVTRHVTEHWGCAVYDEQVFYILHSQECLDCEDDPDTVTLDDVLDLLGYTRDDLAVLPD